VWKHLGASRRRASAGEVAAACARRNREPPSLLAASLDRSTLITTSRARALIRDEPIPSTYYLVKRLNWLRSSQRSSQRSTQAGPFFSPPSIHLPIYSILRLHRSIHYAARSLVLIFFHSLRPATIPGISTCRFSFPIATLLASAYTGRLFSPSISHEISQLSLPSHTWV
jgi:hypothetical protein